MREILAPVAYAFHQLWDGLHPFVAGSDLVPIFTAVRRLNAHGIRYNARDCTGGNRSRRHYGGHDASSLRPIESIASYPVAVDGAFSAFVISFLSGRGGKNARWCF
jgi:hypothetical protein